MDGHGETVLTTVICEVYMYIKILNMIQTMHF